MGRRDNRVAITALGVVESRFEESERLVVCVIGVDQLLVQ
jgi:hypothetical protein